jgi:hypothetical protein
MSEQNNNPPLSELQQKAINWINKKSLNKGCEVCGQNHWGVSTDVVTPIVLKNNSFQLGGTSYPSVVVICNNCGNTKFINAVLAGLIDTTEKDEGQDGK